MNQSAEATVWPLSRVRLSAGSVPRIETFSPCPKALSMVTPGMMVIASATLVAGNLPTSSAVTTSTMASASRLASRACLRLPRMPTTVTVSSSVAPGAVASCAWACIARPMQATIAAERTDLRCFMMSLPSLFELHRRPRLRRRLPSADTTRTTGTTQPRTAPGAASVQSRLLRRNGSQVPAGGADHAQLPVLDELHRDPLQRLAHRPLVEEARTEAAAGQEAAHLRQDPAGQVDALHPVQQGHVAYRASEQAAEHFQRL